MGEGVEQQEWVEVVVEEEQGVVERVEGDSPCRSPWGTASRTRNERPQHRYIGYRTADPHFLCRSRHRRFPVFPPRAPAA